MNDKGTKGGAPGGKEGKPPKAALRHLASLFETPDTGRCRRIVARGDRRHLEILAVEAFIFIHDTGGHWHVRNAAGNLADWCKDCQFPPCSNCGDPYVGSKPIPGNCKQWLCKSCKKQRKPKEGIKISQNWRTLVETGVTGAKKGNQKRHAKFNAEKVANINAKRFPESGQNGCWCGRGVPIA